MPQYKNPLHFGLAVGIDRYPSLGHLQHARGDARAFHAWLTDPEGGSVPPENCRLIVADDKEMPATTAQEKAVPIADQVVDALLAVEKDGDKVYAADATLWKQTRLYYYVSGHGLAVDPRDAALLMANAGRPKSMGRHISSLAVLNYFLLMQTFHELVIFADCCRDRDAGAPWMPLPFNPTLGVQKGAVAKAVCFATLFGEKSFEPEKADGRRGYFTGALLDGLRGEAALSGEAIHSNNLSEFVHQRVRSLTKTDDFFAPQEPEFDCDPAVPILFRPATPAAEAPPEAAEAVYSVTLQFKTYAGTVQLHGGKFKPIGAPQPILAGQEWIVRLPTGLYSVETVPGAAPIPKECLFKVVGRDCRVEF